MNLVTLSMKIIITLAFFLPTILLLDSPCMAHDRFSLEFKNTQIGFDSRTNMVKLYLTTKNRSFGFLVDKEWDVKKVEESIFNIRFKGWKGYHWQADLNNNKIFRVTQGEFDSLKGKKDSLQGIHVKYNSKKPGEFGLLIPSTSVEFRSDGYKRFLVEDSEILRTNDWEITKEEPNKYTITAQGRNVHWIVDLSAKKVLIIGYDGTKMPYDNGLKIHEIDVESKSSYLAASGSGNHSKGPQNADLNIPDDITMAGMKVPYPRSEWLESEKEFNRAILKKSSYDVLIVPFQVQGYAIDRVGRSLMTRYLADRISLTTDAKIPDATLIARALGENDRRYDEKKIFDLADDLKVKVLIRGYVGHNRDEKMSLTLLIQERDGLKKLSPGNKAIRLTWKDIPFSDTSLPSEAFLKVLDEIISKMPFRAVKSIRAQKYDKVGNLPLTQSISSMVASKDALPVLNAFYLQLIGVLYPEQTTAKEHVFERSLAALIGISPESRDYSLLKARAYLYLHRRPAAIAALGKPSSPEGKAFQALLDGNLNELAKWTNEIQSPLLKLMSQIELNDLGTSYGHISDRETYEKITKELPDDLAMLVMNRLLVSDGWHILSNLKVKEKMDEAFPIVDFTAKDLFMSKAAIGEFPFSGDEVDLSVYKHYHRYLMEYGDKICCANPNGLIHEMDYMDLLCAVGESNLLRIVRKRLNTLGLPEDALDILNKVELVYRGHSDFTYLRVLTLRKLAEKNEGQARASMVKQYKENARDVYLWAQGQTPQSSYVNLYILGFGNASPAKQEYFFYEADYPRRYYWFAEKGDRTNYRESFLKGKTYSFVTDSLKRDIQNWEIALQYSSNNITPLESLQNVLINLKEQYKEFNSDLRKKIDNDIAGILTSNVTRFIGHPRRDEVFAKAMNPAGAGKRDIKKDLETQIGSNPQSWKSYFELGSLYLREGDFKKALGTFQRYPLFKGQNEHMVRMSNAAYEAGLELLWNSAVDESIPLLKLAANSTTGSSAEMTSAALLALLEGDYKQAALHFMQDVQRYGDRHGTRDYSLLLHLLGNHDQAWALFNNLNMETYSPEIWTAALVGQRMESKSGKESADWLSRQVKRGVPFEYNARYIFMTAILDRKPDADLSGRIKKLNLPAGDSRKKSERYRDLYSGFAEALYNMRKGEYQKAFIIFKEHEYLARETEMFESALPYVYLSAAKSGRLAELEKDLTKYEKPHNEFVIHLSQAYIKGVAGDHERAMKHLKYASYQIPGTWKRPIFGWYQLVETCEWLYETTNKAGYRAQAVKWAKIHQRIQPMFAWAYAVEARYTDSDPERVRALAITLYLDKQSERISGFSGPDRNRAIKWLNEHNPFTSDPQQKLGI